MNILDWVKNNKLSALLIIVLAFFLLKGSFGNFFGLSRNSLRVSESMAPGYDSGASDLMVGAPRAKSIGLNLPSLSRKSAPQPEVSDRMVVQTSNISMVVDDVRQKMDQVLGYVQNIGGYMVSSRLNQPEEAPYGTLVLRIPSDKLRSSLEQFRNMAVKISSENLQGTDVTDQYMDIDAKLKILERNKAQFEEIMDKASTVDQILKVQREIMNLQTQIDNLKGQQQYMEKTAQNAKITIHISTDEWSLPYAPSNKWRPEVVFKTAVRSLVITLRGLTNKLIWVAVYGIIWIPVVLVIWFIKRKTKKNKAKPPTTSTN